MDDMASKTCTKCRLEKHSTDFYKNKVTKDGFNYWCKVCIKAWRSEKLSLDPAYRQRERLQRYGMNSEDYNTHIAKQNNQCAICNSELSTHSHIDHCHKTSRVRGILCSSCNLALGNFYHRFAELRAAFWHLLHAHSDVEPDFTRTKSGKDKHYLVRYGITLQEKLNMLHEQRRMCPICRIPLTNTRRSFVDHDHESGNIRGVLCFNCNVGLGLFQHNPDYILKAVDYLRGEVPKGLGVICGPMWANKSGELLRIAVAEQGKGKRVLLVKPEIDTRYSTDSIDTHDGFSLPAISISLNTALLEDASREFDVICIDEIQFFDPVIIEKISSLTTRKYVVVAGLDMDYRRKPFQITAELLAAAEWAEKLKAVCRCGKPAGYTRKIVQPTASDTESHVAVGGADMYEARCSDCHLSKD